MNAIATYVEDPRAIEARRLAGVSRDEYPVAVVSETTFPDREGWWVDLRGGFSDPVDLTVSSEGEVHWF